MNREFPSFLARKCTEFVGQTLTVRPEGLRYYIGWQEQALDPLGDHSADMAVTPQMFFEEDGQVRGFVGEVHTVGHPLSGFSVVLSTLSDGENMNFSDNLCRIWKAVFGDSEPSARSGNIPEFITGRIFIGRAVVFEKEVYLIECQERLNRIDPRRGGHG